MQQVELLVDSAYPGDQGGGKARLDPETMLALKISPGDLISISGKRKTVVKVWRSLVEDWNQNKVRIDVFTRKNAKCNIGDKIKISPIKDLVAKQVHFSSPSVGKIVHLQNISSIQNMLIDFPIQINDIVPIGTVFPLVEIKEIKINNIIPKNANRISKETELVFEDNIIITEEKNEKVKRVSTFPRIYLSHNIGNKKYIEYFLEHSFDNFTTFFKNDQKKLEEAKEFKDYITIDINKQNHKILSTESLKHLSHLERISYRENIQKFVNDVEESDKDIHILIKDLLQSLWVKKYDKLEAFQRFETFEDYEKILFKEPHYRDHFIHQFQVFLCGLPIIEQHFDDIHSSYSKLFNPDSPINIEFSWLLAASYHDVGYLVQLLYSWMNRFFVDVLDVKDIKINVDLAKLLQEKDFQENLDKLTSLYNYIYNNTTNEKWKYSGSHYVDPVLRKEFVKKLLNERNHGLISSIILLDRIQKQKRDKEYIDRTFSSIVMPAALSIALHDKAILKIQNLEKNVIFEKDPLSFILIYCDAIQEWGRPSSQNDLTFEQMPQLTNYSISKNEVSATLTYNKIAEFLTPDGATMNTFDNKVREIDEIMEILKSNDVVFKITVESNDPEFFSGKSVSRKSIKF